MDKQLFNRIKNKEIFRRLSVSDSDLESLDVKLRAIGQGDIIYSGHNKSFGLFLIESGHVSLTLSFTEGKSRSIQLKDGNSFGAENYLFEEIKTSFAIAMRDSYLIFIGQKDVEKLSELYPALNNELRKLVLPGETEVPVQEEAVEGESAGDDSLIEETPESSEEYVEEESFTEPGSGETGDLGKTGLQEVIEEEPVETGVFAEQEREPFAAAGSANEQKEPESLDYQIQTMKKEHEFELASARRDALLKFADLLAEDFQKRIRLSARYLEHIKSKSMTQDSLRIANMISEELDSISDKIKTLCLFREGSEVFRPSVKEINVLIFELSNKELPFLLDNAVRVESERGPSLKLSVDQWQFQRMFHEIVKNSCEAMPSGGVIFVSYSVNPDGAEIEIEDESGEECPDLGNKFLEPFYSTKEGHAGLGLTLAAKIAENHGGSLEAAQGKRGIIIRLRIPVKRELGI